MKCQVSFSLAFALAFPLFAQNIESKRVEKAGEVMEQILNAPQRIPEGILDQANCVVIVPSVQKFAVGIGGSYAPGVMTCRGNTGFYGPWGAPAMVALEGNGAELQLSGGATDFVLLLMSPRAADHVLKGKVKLGDDASAAAGPVSNATSKETDVTVRTDILCYSRALGKLTGISLKGSILWSDDRANTNLYGQDISAKDIVFNKAVSCLIAPRICWSHCRVLPRLKN